MIKVTWLSMLISFSENSKIQIHYFKIFSSLTHLLSLSLSLSHTHTHSHSHTHPHPPKHSLSLWNCQYIDCVDTGIMRERERERERERRERERERGWKRTVATGKTPSFSFLWEKWDEKGSTLMLSVVQVT